MIDPKENLRIRLGSDLKAPLNNKFEILNGVDLVIQDIQLGLLTLTGERLNRPTFGTKIRALVWENLDNATAELPSVIEGFLRNNEPRIKVQSVDIVDTNRNTGVILVRISFSIVSTDSITNLIFPFRGSQEIANA